MTHSEPAMLMTVSYDDRWTVRLRGDVDAGSRVQLCSLAGLLRTSGQPVDFDLRRVTFVDRAGWAAICAAADTVREVGTEARVVNPSRPVRRLTDLLSSMHPSRGRPKAGVPHLAPVA